MFKLFFLPLLIHIRDINYVQLGGWNNGHAWSTRSALFWNVINERYEDIGYNTGRIDRHGEWARVPDDSYIFRTCSIY